MYRLSAKPQTLSRIGDAMMDRSSSDATTARLSCHSGHILAQNHFHSKSLYCLTQGEVCFGVLVFCCVCVLSRFPRLLLFSSLVWFLLHCWSSFLVECERLWFPDTEKKVLVPGKFRDERRHYD